MIQLAAPLVDFATNRVDLTPPGSETRNEDEALAKNVAAPADRATDQRANEAATVPGQLRPGACQ